MKRVLTAWLAGIGAFAVVAVLSVVVVIPALGVTELRNGWSLFFDGPEPSFLLPWFTWDGQHYLHLVTVGLAEYEVGQAFFPLYPLLGRALWALGVEPHAALLAVSWSASLVALHSLAQLARQRGVSVGWTLALFLCYPTAYYLHVGYAESLFCALWLTWLVHVRQGRVAVAVACAVLLPLVKGHAAFLGLGYLIWLGLRRQLPERRDLAVLLGFGVGVLLYFGLYTWVAGDPLAGMRAQRFFPFGFSLRNVLDPIGVVTALPQVDGWFSYNGGLADRIAGVLWLAVLPWLVPRLPRLQGVLAATLVWCIVSVGHFSGVLRFTLVVAPLAALVLAGARPEVRRVSCLAMALTQAGLAMLYALAQWV